VFRRFGTLVAGVNQDVSSRVDCRLLLVAIAVKRMRPFARPRQLAQNGPKLDQEIDFDYGSP
jgi:hypothetical protein